MSCILGGVLGLSACSAPIEDAALDDVRTSERQPLAGGFVTNAYGVVEVDTSVSLCTGTMIGPNAVLTAAHCFDDLNVPQQATISVSISYFDPDQGRRLVFPPPGMLGTANLTKNPDYWGWQGSGDLALITIPGVFLDTDYHDYKRLLSYEAGDSLPSSQRFYGAGRPDTDVAPDGQLRTHALTVEKSTRESIVTDNGDGIRVCKGDSGGPLIVVASTAGHPDSLELVSGVLSGMDTSFSSMCASENPVLGDNAYFDRPATSRYVPWIESTIGQTCSNQLPGANWAYKRCFDPPFIEDIDFEGMTQGQEVALVGAIQII